MNAIIGLLTAGALLVPGLGQAAPHHDTDMSTEVIAQRDRAAESRHGKAAVARKTRPVQEKDAARGHKKDQTDKTPAQDAAKESAQDAALAEEMEEIGGEDAGAAAAEAEAALHMERGVAPEDSPAAAAEDAAEDATAEPAEESPAAPPALLPVTLKEGDWVFIEGDIRHGWFFDRSRMVRGADGTIAYWQLILYNEVGRSQFADSMHDEAYENLGYTLQKRVMDLSQNRVRTYDIIVYDREGGVLTESSRAGSITEIQPKTMVEKERDAVKKAARKLRTLPKSQ